MKEQLRRLVIAWLDAAGVDVIQWQALTRAFVRTDFGVLGGAFGQAQAGRARLGLVFVALLYGIMGLGIGLACVATSDALLAGTILSSYVAFIVSTNVFATHAGTIISPDDHAILGFRPVTSRTYFAVRITTILVQTSLTATLLGAMPIVVMTIGRGPFTGIGALADIYLTAIAVTLTILAGYAWLLRVAGPDRLGRIATYAQTVSTLTMYLGFALLSRSAVRDAVSGMRLADKPWMLFYPGTWLGSYVAIGRGHVDGITVAAALLSFAMFGALAWALAGKLSLDYSERLATLASATVAPTRAASRPWQRFLFLNGEARAVAMLVRSQFKNDNRFRMGVFAFLPITIYYLYLGSQNGPMPDPFIVSAGSGHNQVMFLQVVLYFLPASLKRIITSSDSYRASWIFHVSPADRTKLVIGARNAITLFIVVPYLLLLGGYFAWSFGNVWHAALMMVFLGLMSQIVFEVIVLIDPRLPFSDPPNRAGGGGAAMAGAMIAMMIVGAILYFVIVNTVLFSNIRIVVALIALSGIVWLLDRLTQRRIAGTVEDLTYLA